MNTNYWLEMALLGVIFLGIISVFANRFHLKKGVGKRTIQFTIILIALPLTAVLGIEQILDSTTIAAIYGAVVGNALNGLNDSEGA